MNQKSKILGMAMTFLLAVAWVASSFAYQVATAREAPKQEAINGVFSGPQPNEEMPALNVLPLLEDSNELIALVPAKPKVTQVIVFVHERTRPAFGVIRGLAAFAKELGDRLDPSIVFLTDDINATRQWGNVARSSMPTDLRLTVGNSGIEGPGEWGLNRNVALTVVIGVDGKTTDNFAIIQPSAAVDTPKIVKAIAKTIGIDPPSDDQIKTWTGQARMNTENATVDIRPLLAPVIRLEATKEKVDEAAKKVEEAAATDEAFKQAVGDACRRIVSAGKLENYGTEFAQAYLKTWAKDFGVDRDAERKTPSGDAKKESDRSKTDK